MSIEAILLASIPGVLALIGVYLQARADKNKPRVDISTADRTLAEAEKVNAEAEQLRAQITRDILAQVESDRQNAIKDRNQMQAEINDLRRQFNIVVSFARAHYEGSKILYQQVKRHEEPQFIPAEKFPTGPLGAA